MTYKELEIVIENNTEASWQEWNIKEALESYIDEIVEQIHEYFKGEIDSLDDDELPWDILKHNKAVCKIVKGGASDV